MDEEYVNVPLLLHESGRRCHVVLVCRGAPRGPESPPPLSSRAVHSAEAAGLGPARRLPSDVCQQPSKWPHHLRWAHPAELLVGSQWLRGDAVCHHFRPHSATEPVGAQTFKKL